MEKTITFQSEGKTLVSGWMIDRVIKTGIEKLTKEI